MILNIRKWHETDLENLVKHANNFNIAKFMSNAFPFPYTKKHGEEFILNTLKDNPTKRFAIDVDGNAVGSIGIMPQTDIHELNAELGYWLSEDYWGKGIVTNAIIEIVKYAFDTFEINRIFARPFSSNHSSHRVLEKAGFKLEAQFNKTIYKNGEYLDELIYAIRKTI